MQVRNQSNILEYKTLIHSNGAMTDNLTSRLIPECDVFLTNHGVRAREPSRASSHVAGIARICEPRVL
jgi:3-dehydroquinate dehydratase